MGSGSSKPQTILVNDEECFHQFLIGTKQWMLSSEKIGLLPKTEGTQIIISVFQSRIYGWGYDVDDDRLSKINNILENPI